MKGNPYLVREANREKQSTAYWRAPKHEESVAKRVNGRKTIGSGSKKKKGDIYIDNVARIECKTTGRKSFSITQEMLDKIQNACIGCGEVPAIVVEFINGQGRRKDEVAVLPMWALEQLLANQHAPHDTDEEKS